MHQFIAQIVNGKLTTTGAQISLMVEVTFEVAIYTRHCGVSANIELPLVDQKWVVDILLNNASPL